MVHIGPVLLGAQQPILRAGGGCSSTENDDTSKFRALNVKTGALLTFDELVQKVDENDIEGVTFKADALDLSQREKLVVRSVPLGLILRNAAGVLTRLQACDGTEFSKSQPSQSIDYFLSHAWLTGRRVKYLALLYYYNFQYACLANLVTGLIGLVICFALRRDPLLDQRLSETQYKLLSAIALLLVPALAFILVFIFGLRLPGRLVPTMFLDKLCIHQQNRDLKLLGIGSLELMVQSSRRLLVIYDACTYERMWCAYEVAMFVKGLQGKAEDVHFVPVCAALTAVGIVLTSLLACPFAALISALTPPEPAANFWSMCTYPAGFWGFLASVTYALICYVPEGYLVRRCVEDMACLSQALENFDMDVTKCTDENDRVEVSQRIVESWGSMKNFNDFVRRDVSQAVGAAIGGVNYTPWFDIYARSPIFLCFFSWLALNSPSYAFSEAFLGGVVYSVTVVPLCTVRWFRLGCLAHKWLQHRPVACSLAITAMMAVSCYLHSYVHSTSWWHCHRLAERLRFPGSAILLFSPVLVIEFYVLSLHGKVKQVRSMRLHKWDALDWSYYGGLASTAAVLLIVTNVLHAREHEPTIVSWMHADAASR
eukprot:TRINITY_DN16189_c0_g2_i1.p1 TRINITY_DN16189_c0_g2~~TRINITY_DN16189_c0_g2_i1.p1  ORF type:complete len:598 (+),score=67.28 TRINITY_DN16189_c0_g2_i1:144-1937(+)